LARKDRQHIRAKLKMSIDLIDPTDHPDKIVNIVSGRIASSSVKVDKLVGIRKAQMVLFEDNSPKRKVRLRTIWTISVDM
jgi:hypothetical protein